MTDENRAIKRLSVEQLEGYVERIKDDIDASKRSLDMYEDALRWRREFDE